MLSNAAATYNGLVNGNATAAAAGLANVGCNGGTGGHLIGSVGHNHLHHSSQQQSHSTAIAAAAHLAATANNPHSHPHHQLISGMYLGFFVEILQ